MHSIRRLAPDDAPALFALRLDALRTDPDAFLATYDEERARGVGWVTERLHESQVDPVCGVTGAVVDGALAGMIGCVRGPRVRARHKALLWGTWVAPAVRGRGLGRALLAATLDHLRGAGELEQVQLSVTTTQVAARALYMAAGFVPFGLEERALKIGERYLDEEHLVLRLRS